MKKKLLLTSLASILVIIIAFIFIYNSHKIKDPIKRPSFYVLHGKNFDYPFEIEVPYGTSYLEAVAKLGTTKEISKIYMKEGKSWVEVKSESPVRTSSEIKVEE